MDFSPRAYRVALSKPADTEWTPFFFIEDSQAQDEGAGQPESHSRKRVILCPPMSVLGSHSRAIINIMFQMMIRLTSTTNPATAIWPNRRIEASVAKNEG